MESFVTIYSTNTFNNKKGIRMVNILKYILTYTFSLQ